MSNALVTISAPITADKIPAALERIRRMGNPASESVQAALRNLDGDKGVHFASLHALPPTDPDAKRGHLVLEFSADGEDDEAIEHIASRIEEPLREVFSQADDWNSGELAGYLKAHKLTLGHGWTGQAGLAFAGTPGMTVGRILREAEFASEMADWVGEQDGGMSALVRLEHIRAEVRRHHALDWALETPDALAVAPKATTLALIAPIGWSFIKTYLWPLAIPLVVVLLAGLLQAATVATGFGDDGGWMAAWRWTNGLWRALLWVLSVLCAFAVPVLCVLAVLYLSLRRAEATDFLDDRGPRREVLQQILETENHHAHNHMVSVTTRKPGLTRLITLRLAFWLIACLARLSFKPGFLGEIGTIHFARWVSLPGSRDLVFFSNYGGSWESYLEDFITKAHNGLTAVWSNTVGFPRTQNLFQKGATDGERFKRYARRSMLPTPFWYSAYPTLTTANIRTNAAIRVGLAVAMSDEEAVAWLALFGSAARPAAKLESDQIQSLVFGGLGFMPHGEILLIDLRADRQATRDWLRSVRSEIAYDDGRRLKRKAVITLALGPGALRKAGLPEDAVESFPPAFLDGMTGPGRSRILGDQPDDPERPWWWKTEGTYDAAVLVYGKTQPAADALVEKLRALTQDHGHRLELSIPLHPIPPDPSERKEPFGFVDGVSQPVIRGTYRGFRNPDPIHLVEPGEFVLGYPDNRGNIPPGPTLKALDDPENRLPIQCDQDGGFGSSVVNAPREIGRNGSFLVIRQLEQDVAAFQAYCDEEAERLKGRLGEPYQITSEFIAAKTVGRWADGSSLVRNPYLPFTGASPLEQRPTLRPASRPTGATAAAIAAPAAVTAPPSTPLLPTALLPTALANAPRTARVEDNDFLFGTEDPQGLRCPFGAHIRRANPRDSLDPGSQDQIDISNRHRIIRIGRTYVAREGEKDGLMFMCLNGDIERQFEFVQQTWMGSETFHGLSGERDPLAGNKSGCPSGFTVPTRDGPIRLNPMTRFVTPRGGGYFFLPGKKLVEFLSS